MLDMREWAWYIYIYNLIIKITKICVVHKGNLIIRKHLNIVHNFSIKTKKNNK